MFNDVASHDNQLSPTQAQKFESLTMQCGVIFDLDETLIDRRSGITRYAADLWKTNQTRLPLSESAFIQVFLALDNNGNCSRKELFRSLCKEVISFADSNTLEEHFFNHAWLSPTLFPQVETVLNTLRSKGYRLGVVSNGSERSQSEKIKRSGLDQLVDAYVISEAFGVQKPDPAIYQEIVNRLDIRPQTSWFIGDSALQDIIAPAKFGFHTIWIPRYSEWPSDEPYCYTKTVKSISEIVQIIDERCIE